MQAGYSLKPVFCPSDRGVADQGATVTVGPEQSEIPGAVAAGKIDRCTLRTVGDAERPAAAMVYVGQRLGRSRQQVGHVNHVAAAEVDDSIAVEPCRRIAEDVAVATVPNQCVHPGAAGEDLPRASGR